MAVSSELYYSEYSGWQSFSIFGCGSARRLSNFDTDQISVTRDPRCIVIKAEDPRFPGGRMFWLDSYHRYLEESESEPPVATDAKISGSPAVQDSKIRSHDISPTTNIDPA
jgi:hypothetical protein